MGTRQAEAPIRIFVTRRIVTLTLLCALLAAFVLFPLRPGLSNPAANDPPPPPTEPPLPPAGSIAPRAELPVVQITAARYPCQSEVEGATVPGSGAEYAVVEPDIHSEYVMGCVRDAGGRPVARALVVSWALNGHHIVRRAGARAGPDGRYAERAVSGPGWWQLVASAPGYEPQTRRVLALQDRTAVLDFVLEPSRDATPTPAP